MKSARMYAPATGRTATRTFRDRGKKPIVQKVFSPAQATSPLRSVAVNVWFEAQRGDVWSARMSSHEVKDQARDLVSLLVEREMARVQQVDFGIG